MSETDLTIAVLDLGMVQLVDHMGDDARIVQAARVSYGAGTKTKRADDKLIDYLMKNDHSSPFEKVVFEFHIKCPLFVAAQWRTYRNGSFNQLSGRYSVMEEEFYEPQVGRYLAQSSVNRQASGEPLSRDQQFTAAEIVHEAYREAYTAYANLLELGVAREIARIVLPDALYTRFYWTVNLWNIFHFIEQRMADEAQWEIAQYAKAITFIVKQITPVAYESFKNHHLGLP